MNDLSAKELEKLLNLIAYGDNAAVQIIYRHYQKSLYAFIRLRVRDDHVAEELLNDTFMIAFKRATQYNGTSEFMTWLCGIAKNVCGTWIRKQNSGIEQATDYLDEDVFNNLPAPDLDILSKLEAQEIECVLRECIDKLPISHKEAIYWTWFEDVPIERVADKLECPIGTIKSRLFNARLKIANCVKNVFESGLLYE